MQGHVFDGTWGPVSSMSHNMVGCHAEKPLTADWCQEAPSIQVVILFKLKHQPMPHTLLPRSRLHPDRFSWDGSYPIGRGRHVDISICRQQCLARNAKRISLVVCSTRCILVWSLPKLNCLLARCWEMVIWINTKIFANGSELDFPHGNSDSQGSSVSVIAHSRVP